MAWISFPPFPKLDVPRPDVAELAKDAAYVTVGLAVLGFQKLQVRRREIERAVSTLLDRRP